MKRGSAESSLNDPFNVMERLNIFNIVFTIKYCFVGSVLSQCARYKSSICKEGKKIMYTLG